MKNKTIKQKLYEFFNKFLRQDIKQNTLLQPSAETLAPPYDYVQIVTEKYIHKYIGLVNEGLNSWCIVGGFLGSEAQDILKNYPKAQITIFECSQRYVENLTQIYRGNKNVTIVNKAASNSNGTFRFYENSADGTGSLLKGGSFLEQSYGIKQAESYEVEAITLDGYFKDQGLDVLQIDVQGAEKLVLEGATKLLKRTKACFVEVSVKPDLYQNAVTLDELLAFFKDNGFQPALLGTDFNLTGNALFLNKKYIENVNCTW